ncbi:uncharacterized protein A4U43_C01F22750 [Asparagus officinalis]|uniref:Uncharacterized protein n=1 Tax=Asparagus officinalis TaxID=4686 RepID=A0A5P1FTX3_ASPOF|nr:uncharacterized protein A4U43_C01F22750 [Asparagus officinalis]
MFRPLFFISMGALLLPNSEVLIVFLILEFGSPSFFLVVFGMMWGGVVVDKTLRITAISSYACFLIQLPSLCFSLFSFTFLTAFSLFLFSFSSLFLLLFQ